MNPSETINSKAEAILVLAPTGSDGPRAVELLVEAGFEAVLCRSILELSQRIEQPCAAVLIAEEALFSSPSEPFLQALRKQPTWSDLPILVVTSGGKQTRQSLLIFESFRRDGDVTLLERPFRTATLTSMVEGALRARRRQYQVRDLLREQESLHAAAKGQLASLKASEESLRAALAREAARAEELKAVMDSAPTPVWIATDATATEILGNPASYELLGIAPGSNVSTTALQKRELPYRLFKEGIEVRGLELPMQRAARTGEAIRNEEIELRMHGGVTKTILMNASPVKNGDGHPAGAVATAVDITERKRMLASLRASELGLQTRNQRLQMVADTFAHLLKAKDLQSAIAGVFPKIAQSLGVDTYLNFLLDGTGKALRLASSAGIPKEALPGLDRLELGQAICGTVAMTWQPMVATHIQESSDPRAALVRGFGIRAYACNPLIVGDKLIGTLSFASHSRDEFEDEEIQYIRLISQYISVALVRLKTENELQSLNEGLEQEVAARTARLRETIEELEAFSYSITHDLRAPLRTMQSFCGVLLEDVGPQLNAEAKDYLERIINASRRMDALIRDVLAYSRVLRTDLELRPLDLLGLIRGIVLSYPNLQPDRAEVLVEGDMCHVMANEAALTQCVSNLLNNAVKFVAPGVFPRVRVWAEKTGDRVRVWFEDNGVGIDPAYQDRIFTLFQRVSKGYEGTGLGLSIVRKAAERMGGNVGVQSTMGEGSRFWLELECARRAA